MAYALLRLILSSVGWVENPFAFYWNNPSFTFSWWQDNTWTLKLFHVQHLLNFSIAEIVMLKSFLWAISSKSDV